MNYNFTKLDLTKDDIIEYERLSIIRSFFDLFFLIISTIIIIKISILLLNNNYFFLIPPFMFIIASRVGAFLNLMHEAAHSILFKHIHMNNIAGKWFLGFPIGIIFEDYTKRHLHHHAHTTTEKEPQSDKDKYEIVDYKNKKIFLYFLYDLIGFSALKVFFSIGEKNVKKNKSKNVLLNLLKILFVQIIIILFVFEFNYVNYFIFWLYPIIGPHMFLMRIRGVAEHGLFKQKNIVIKNVQEGLLNTRSFLTPSFRYTNIFIFIIEKFLIGTFNVNYHHEHHLCPKIPHYNLENFHKKIYTKVLNLNSDVYEKGYLKAFFWK